MPRLRLKGMFVPNVTPFTRDGRLDVQALRSCVRFWLENDVSGLVPCGSNGEAPYLSWRERKKVIGTVVDEVNGRVPVVAGTGSVSTAETVAFTEDAKDLGVDAVLVVTPYYFRLSNREVCEHFRAVSEALEFPMVVYNVPKFTGFSLEPAVVSQIVQENENVVGVKDSSGNTGSITEILRLVDGRIPVLAGTGDVALPVLMLGGSGAVVAVANVFPKLCSRLYEAFCKGDFEEASQLQRRVSFANEVLVKRHNQLSAIKAALNMQGFPGGYPRRPALPLDDEEVRDVENLLRMMREQDALER